MERYVDMKSPLTGGPVKEVSTTEVKEFRRERYTVHVRYYVCEDTGEQFTTTEQDTLQFNDLYSQYRVRHGIPFPDEIRAIRERYGLNYSQISKILGFGVNQYAKYENGEMPSESNGKMIAAISNKSVLLNMLESCRNSFQEPEYSKVLRSVSSTQDMDNSYSPLSTLIFGNSGRSIYNGYAPKNLEKMFAMIRYILKRTGKTFPTKLNKLMYYADFYHYSQVGVSISGLQYRAISYGPVPNHYETIYDNVPELTEEIVFAHDMPTKLLICNTETGIELLSENEVHSLDYVIERFRDVSVKQIVELSHLEQAWQNAVSNHSLIPYDTAFDMVGI